MIGAYLLFLSVISFLSPRRCFKYFKGRYGRDQLEKLNEALRVRGKLNSVLFNVVVLRSCLSNGIAPKGNPGSSACVRRSSFTR